MDIWVCNNFPKVIIYAHPSDGTLWPPLIYDPTADTYEYFITIYNGAYINNLNKFDPSVLINLPHLYLE